jgi:hypothetical protein
MSAGNGTDAQPPRKDYFGERVAELYDESTAAMFEPAVVDPAVDLLAELAGDRAALELGIGGGPPRARRLFRDRARSRSARRTSASTSSTL